jgi:glyoxylase-like metal-dependent hydrolase (beta-lactamase superfamily II)
MAAENRGGDMYRVSGPDLTHPLDPNGFVLLGKDGAVAVDGPTPLGKEEWKRNLGSLGLRPSDIRLGVVTHCHYDHSATFAEEGIPIGVHVDDRRAIEDGDATLQSFFLYLASGRRVRPYHNTVPLRHRQVIRVGINSLVIHHTPGHTPGSIVPEVRTPKKYLPDFVPRLEAPQRAYISRAIGGDILWGGCSAGVGSNPRIWKHQTIPYLFRQGFDEITAGHCVNEGTRNVDLHLAEADAHFDEDHVVMSHGDNYANFWTPDMELTDLDIAWSMVRLLATRADHALAA